MTDPIYTAENVRLADELRRSLALFWKNPGIAADSWLSSVFQFGFVAGTFGPYDMNTVRKGL
jgi:hypothetical protein